MSGIFAYTGNELCRDIIFGGIACLEHRGRELFGSAIKGESGISLFKSTGSPKELKENIQKIKSEGFTGLAECKNASRIKASAITSVPCAGGGFAVSLDGEIENFEQLKRRLNVSFPVASDEDLALALMCTSDETQTLFRLNSVMNAIEGSPTAVVITDSEEAIYCKAGEAPLIIGIFEEGIAVASELYALLPQAKRYLVLEEGELAKITKERALIYDEKLRRRKKPLLPIPEIRAFENDFRLKDEVFCLPVAVKDTLTSLVKGGELTLDGFNPSRRRIEKTKRVIFTGSGDSFFAAALGAHFIEQLSDLPCEAYPSGELRFLPKLFDRGTLLIAVSSRGESADTVFCAKRAASFGAKTLAITSAPHSFLARCCDETISPNSDFTSGEVCLRSFISSGLTLCLAALRLGLTNEVISEIYFNVALKIAEMLPGKISAAVKPSQGINALAKDIINSESVMLTGLGADLSTCADSAEKIRKITGVFCFSKSLTEAENEAGEFIKRTKIIAVISNGELLTRALRHLRRLTLVGADITLIAAEGLEEEITGFEKTIAFPDSIPLFNWCTGAVCLYSAAVTAKQLIENESADKAV